ncbi:MAG: hypothetical protein AB7F31_00455 [Parachlamydiales bacterium]
MEPSHDLTLKGSQQALWEEAYSRAPIAIQRLITDVGLSLASPVGYIKVDKERVRLFVTPTTMPNQIGVARNLNPDQKPDLALFEEWENGDVAGTLLTDLFFLRVSDHQATHSSLTQGAYERDFGEVLAIGSEEIKEAVAKGPLDRVLQGGQNRCDPFAPPKPADSTHWRRIALNTFKVTLPDLPTQEPSPLALRHTLLATALLLTLSLYGGYRLWRTLSK